MQRIPLFGNQGRAHVPLLDCARKALPILQAAWHERSFWMSGNPEHPC